MFAPHPHNEGSPDDGGAHPDHLACGQIVRAAARLARFSGARDLRDPPWRILLLYSYVVPRWTRPDFFVDVSSAMDEWEQLCRHHHSQLELREGKVLEMLRDQRQRWGEAAGCEYAEAFISARPIKLAVDSLFPPTPVRRDDD